ncbi:MAG: POTRA domain-containing protein [Bryobacteraceae bacterium]|jgi:outer membrane protein assembly factor BamA
MMRLLKLVAALLLAPAALAQHPVMEIKVAGNDRLAAAAVIAASGLHKGQTATRAQLDAAAKKLADTGFFSTVSYRYDPKTVGGVTGYALTFQVSEQTSLTPVELDIPGQDEDSLWQLLKSADALIDKQMPNNDRASDYYKRAIEAVLRKSNHPEEIVVNNEADIKTGKTWVSCRPAHLPKIAAIRFEGNAAIADRTLQAHMAKVAIGQDFTERDVRRALELNLRPLYEELGHLTVSFPHVNMADAGDAGVNVTAAIDEGPAWRLGTVRLTGDALPMADMHDAARFAQGSPANWKQFMLSVEKMEQVLRRDGYITVSSKPVRAFNDRTQVVDVNVQVRKGSQFLFGELHTEGLDADTQQRLAGLWKLPKGAPMNQPYINEFVRSAQPVLRGKFKSFSSELHVHKDANIVDVTLKFR